VLTGPNGHALYFYDPDTSTASKCTDACATTWPPLVGTPSAGAGLEASELTTMSRSDGSTQVAYDGHPLYYYAKDTDAEDMYGEGVGGVWHLATTTGSSGGGASSSSSSGKYGSGY
jgi:predicted lipoprotein with Yx(FWY)xxD motif